MRPDAEHNDRSELLRELAAGRLDATRSASLRDHLATCSDCRAELRAVQTLRGAAQQALSEQERTELHEGVLTAVRASRRPAPVARAAQRRWRERLIPALAAAAVLAVVGVGGASLLRGLGSGGGLAGSADSGGATALSDRATDRAAARALRAPFLGDVGELEQGDLLRLADVEGAKGAAIREETAAAEAYEQRQAAPSVVAAQIRRCTRSVANRRRLLLPAFAATGRVEGKPVVVVGFRRGRSGPLSVWAWPRGSCGAPELVEAGRPVP